MNGDVMRDWMAQKTKAFHDFQAQAGDACRRRARGADDATRRRL